MQRILLIVFLFLVSGVAHAQPIMPEIGQADLEDFLDEPETTRPQLSPNGRYLAYMVHTDHNNDGDILVIQDLDSDDPSTTQQAGFGRYPIVNIEWASNNRVLITLLLDGEIRFGRAFMISAPILLVADRRKG